MSTTRLLIVAFLLVPQLALANPEGGARNANDNIVPKLDQVCGLHLKVAYDGDSLRKFNQDIRNDQTDGALECNEPLRLLWYACKQDKKAVANVAQIVCKGTPSNAGALTRKGDTISVERAFEEKNGYERARAQFERAFGVKLELKGVENPYYDQPWRELQLQPNPVTSTTDYCLVNGDKKPLASNVSDPFVRRKEDATIKCLRAGEVITELTVKAGLLNGYATDFQDQRARRTSYRDGKQHGELRTSEQGKLTSVAMYEQGEQVWIKELFPSGKLRSYSRRYSDGYATFEQHEDGKVYRLQCSPRAGADEVMRTPCGFASAVTTSVYDGTGKIARIETYRNGQLQKVAPGDSNYAERVEVSFVDGKKQGEERQYTKDGKLARLTTWDHGLQQGRELEYAEDGKKVLKETLWSADKPTRISEFYLNGNPKLLEVFANPNEKQHTEYWDLGKVKREGKLVLRSSVRWGSEYRDWLPEGLQRGYYETGALQSEESYRDGKLNGISKQLWPNGNPASIDQYADGVRTASKRWEEGGKLIADEEFEPDGSRKVK